MGLDGEPPSAVGLIHGLLGIGDNVHEDLLHLVEVGHGRGEVGSQITQHLYIVDFHPISVQFQAFLKDFVD